MKFKIVNLVCILFLIVSSCATSRKIKSRTIDCTKKANDAIALYKTKKYSRAKAEFEEMKLQCNGSTVMDTVLYYLGMTNIQLKQFIEARTEMELLVQDFPASVYHEDAQFRIPYCVYRQSNSFDRDQKETEESIRLFRNLLEIGKDGPAMDSVRYFYKEAIEKLAKKEFTTALFYEKLEKYEAAVVCYKTFVDEYPQSQFTDQAHLNMVGLLVKMDRKSDAKEILDKVIALEKSSEFVEKVKMLIEK